MNPTGVTFARVQIWPYRKPFRAHFSRETSTGDTRQTGNEPQNFAKKSSQQRLSSQCDLVSHYKQTTGVWGWEDDTEIMSHVAVLGLLMYFKSSQFVMFFFCFRLRISLWSEGSFRFPARSRRGPKADQKRIFMYRKWCVRLRGEAQGLTRTRR